MEMFTNLLTQRLVCGIMIKLKIRICERRSKIRADFNYSIPEAVCQGIFTKKIKLGAFYPYGNAVGLVGLP